MALSFTSKACCRWITIFASGEIINVCFSHWSSLIMLKQSLTSINLPNGANGVYSADAGNTLIAYADIDRHYLRICDEPSVFITPLTESSPNYVLGPSWISL